MYIKQIKEYFKNKNLHQINANIINKYLENNINIEIYLKEILEKEPEWESIRNIILGIVFDIKLHKCKVCNKIIKFSKRKNTFCSPTCRNKDIDNINQQKLTRKNTCLERFGCTCNWKTQDSKNKAKITNLKKYGVEHFMKSEECKAKYRQDLQEKYGVDNVFQLESIKNKIRNTCLQKYGVDNSFKSEEVRNTFKKNLKEKYNVESPFQISGVMDRIVAKRYIRQYNNFSRFANKVIPMFTVDEYQGDGYYNVKYKWKCVRCNNIFYASSFSKEPRCLICDPLLNGHSKEEKELVTFCKQYYPNLIENDRKLIKPLEIDILIPDIKLGIEFNGTYYHSIEAGIQYGYHLKKTELCEAKGYRLIHIWEFDYLDKSEYIKNELIKVFNNTEEINKYGILDRCWYSSMQCRGMDIINPTIMEINGLHIENCGYFKLRK